MINLLNSSRNDSSLLIVVREPQHGKSFSSSSLTIAHHGAVVAIHDTLDNGCGRKVVDIILSGIVQNVIKLELPVIQLIVHGSMVLLVSVNQKFLSCTFRLNIVLTPEFVLILRFEEAN
jgi:hypothetical protein